MGHEVDGIWHRILAIAASALAAAGCSVGVGARASTPVGPLRPHAPHGEALHLDTSLHLSREDGIVLGTESEVGVATSPDYSGPEDTWRLGLRAGFADLPLPYRPSPLGFELMGRTGVGRLPTDGDTEAAGYLGIDLGLFARFRRARTLSRSERLLWPSGLWFLDLGGEVYSVPDPSSSPGLRCDLSAMLGYRIYVWSSVWK